MKLSVIEQNGNKIYKVQDNNSLEREVTFEYVKFLIESGDLPGYYVDANGNILSDADPKLKNVVKTEYILLGRLFDENLRPSGYLLQHKATNKVLKSADDTFRVLVTRGIVEGAYINNGEICMVHVVDEYQLVNTGGKLLPRKLKSKKTVTTDYEMVLDCEFSTVHETMLSYEGKIVRGKAVNDILGGRHKYPEIVEIHPGGIVIELDTEKVSVQLLNKQDIVDDIADIAELSFEYKQKKVKLRILNIDYRLNAFSLAIAVYLSYKKLVNNFVKLNEVIISGLDNTYWSANIADEQQLNVNTAIKRKTKADINTIRELYNVEKGPYTLDTTDNFEKSLIQGLKLGFCTIFINCKECSYTSTAFKLDFVEQEVYMKFQSNVSDKVEELIYKGKNVGDLTPVMACIIAATAVAAQHTISNVSIADSRTNNSFELLFKLKTELDVQTNLRHILNN